MSLDHIQFTVLGKPEPQGSTKAFLVKGRPRITCDNENTVPYRQQVGRVALKARADSGTHDIWAERHQPVSISYDFYFSKPKSAKKTRISPSVKPDLDKLIRSTTDALTGIMYDDDGQIVEVSACKRYGLPERTEINLWRLS